MENKYFIELIKAFDSSYKLPSRYTFTNKLLNEQFEETIAKIRREVSAADTISLTLDMWTSVQSYPYLGNIHLL